jgi:histidyl-tRNA synthetase
MSEKVKIKARIPSGFLELLPQDQIVFNGIMEKIRSIYEKFGFTPVETPALEFTEVILAKGGGETDKQIYRIQKEGDDISLHFDLTVPLARYVAEHYEDLTFPFRRYQMQKVWRGERKQKGRFREFYQCDIDVIGTENIFVDAEIPSVIYEVFLTLGFNNFTIRINNRKILNGFLEELKVKNFSKEILRAIDKLEKQGEKAVIEEMSKIGISAEKIEKIISFIKISGTNEEIISSLKNLGISNSIFSSGIADLDSVTKSILTLGVPRNYFRIDLSIARGLDYYTGTVYETILNDYPEIGSVCSGGRFDDLAEYYTDKKLPGVGISIGLTRLFYKLKEAGLIKSGQATPSQVLISQLDSSYIKYCLEIATKLRHNGINTEIYFESDKIGKQIKYASKLKIPFVIIVGESEIRGKIISLKIMENGKQLSLSIDDAISKIKEG